MYAGFLGFVYHSRCAAMRFMRSDPLMLTYSANVPKPIGRMALSPVIDVTSSVDEDTARPQWLSPWTHAPATATRVPAQLRPSPRGQRRGATNYPKSSTGVEPAENQRRGLGEVSDHIDDHGFVGQTGPDLAFAANGMDDRGFVLRQHRGRGQDSRMPASLNEQLYRVAGDNSAPTVSQLVPPGLRMASLSNHSAATFSSGSCAFVK